MPFIRDKTRNVLKKRYNTVQPVANDIFQFRVCRYAIICSKFVDFIKSVSICGNLPVKRLIFLCMVIFEMNVLLWFKLCVYY